MAGRAIRGGGAGVGGVPSLLLVLVLCLSWRGVRCSPAAPAEQQQQDSVGTLPGQQFNVSFAHYSGYITVNEASGRNLFYWFFEAADDPASKPVVLWLNGGPGCSSVAYGLAEEVGPFHIKPDGKTLYLNPYSWNQVANIIFLDSPVGVGYSYSNKSEDLLSNGDERTAKDTLVFLKKWFKRYPQYSGREFYISGESYAGHYVPQLAQAIVRSQKLNGEDSINLKGYMAVGKLSEKYDPCTEQHSTQYFNLPEVQKALHISPAIAPNSWETCSDVVNENWKDSPRSVLNVYRELLGHGLRIWMFSGDTDAVIPVTSTRYSIDSLRLPTVTPWHAWYDDDGQVGGWTQVYKGLTFVTVRGAGHEVPLHRPKQALTLFKAFLSGSPMPTLTGAADS